MKHHQSEGDGSKGREGDPGPSNAALGGWIPTCTGALTHPRTRNTGQNHQQRPAGFPSPSRGGPQSAGGVPGEGGRAKKPASKVRASKENNRRETLPMACHRSASTFPATARLELPHRLHRLARINRCRRQCRMIRTALAPSELTLICCARSNKTHTHRVCRVIKREKVFNNYINESTIITYYI